MPAAIAPDLIVFDLDGTLVDTLDDLTGSANRLLAHEGGPAVTTAQVRPMVGDGVAALVRRLLDHARIEGRDADAVAFFMADYERHAAGASRLFEGAHETLLALLQQGWRLAVCTNKPWSAARILLDTLEVTPLLAAVGGGDSFPTRKPDPGHLLGTIAAAGGTPSRTVMVGDHRNDIAAATGAGAASIFARWGYGHPAMADGASARATAVMQIPAIATALLGGHRAA